MEDFKRELENEIKVYSRSTPTGRTTIRKLIWIDDRGNVQPAGWLKILTYLILAVALVSSATAFALGWLYTDGKQSTQELIEKLSVAEKRIAQLISEKEILMANLVMSGARPGGFSNSKVSENGNKKNVLNQNKLSGTASPLQLSSPLKKDAVIALEPDKENALADPGQGTQETVQSNIGASDSNSGLSVPDTVTGSVRVEGLKVSKDNERNEIRVIFSLQKTTNHPGNITGNVFVILKKGDEPESEWLVIPQVATEDGMPIDSARGQYFSIINFKTMSFKTICDEEPDRFTSAAVIIYEHGSKTLMASEEVRLQTDE